VVVTSVHDDCPGHDASLRLPDACVGETTSGAATFCFAPDCLGGGVVLAFDPPPAPFSVTAIHVEGLLGSHPAVFPQLLLPGDQIVADITVAIPPSGAVSGRYAWALSTEEDREDDACESDVEAAAPVCAGGTPGDACGEVCVAGTCAPVTPGGACDDGDPCTVGDQCVDGVCRPGPRLECPSNACFVGTCVAGACGSVPVDCDDRNPCTVDTCDLVSGCVHTVSTAPCDDGDACTTGDRCDGGVCRGTPVVCGSDECTLGSCRPDDPAADARGCVAVAVGEGEACSDDGVACTDDVCTGGVCLHVPIDARCGDAGGCSAAACAPDREDHDPRGCALVEGSADTASCGDDGDPCTVDACAAGSCTHTPVADAATCAPVRPVFQKTLGLAVLARSVMGGMDSPSAHLHLEHAAEELDAAGAVLAGKADAGAAAAAPGFAPSVAQQRARVAFTRVLHTPAEVRSFLAVLAEAQARAELEAATTRALRRRGRLLLRGTKTLKGDLRRLQRVSQTFAR